MSENIMLVPFHNAASHPSPSCESIFQKLNGFLDAVSPFCLAELLSKSDIVFRSAICGVTMVIPVGRRRGFLQRMITLAGLQVSQPNEIGLISNRVQTFLEPSLTTPLVRRSAPGIAYTYQDLDSLDRTKAMMEYYMYSHEYELFPTINGCRPAVLVSAFLDPDLVDGDNIGLMGTLNPQAEEITGYTSAEFHHFQNVITSDYSNNDGFPQVLRIYHNEDIHIFMAKTLMAFLNPWKEIPFELRIIHKSGLVIPVRVANIATIKPDGQLKSLTTVVAPIQFI